MLDLRGVSRRYGQTVALEGLSLAVPEGEVVGFVGPNGAGKTTAMRIALGVLEADEGAVLWRGAPVTREQQRLFGYMLEERGLYPKMRVARHLRYLAELHGRDGAPHTRRRRAGSSASASPSMPSSASRSSLSAISSACSSPAALVHDPPVLILDEPFSGLDPIGTDVMSEVLAERAADGAAVIFSSHRLELVERVCHRVAIVTAAA